MAKRKMAKRKVVIGDKSKDEHLLGVGDQAAGLAIQYRVLAIPTKGIEHKYSLNLGKNMSREVAEANLQKIHNLEKVMPEVKEYFNKWRYKTMKQGGHSLTPFVPK